APDELKRRVPGLTNLLRDVRGRVATVTIQCNVPGARVLLRDRNLGVTPLGGPQKVNAGRAVVEVEAAGYHPYREEIDLPGGGSLTIDAKLSSTSTSGILVITSPTSGALVAVDGKAAGAVPVEVVVGAGSHRIELRRDGFERLETSAVVAAG